MVTKVNGPRIEDYKRALKAAKWAGRQSRPEWGIGGGAIAILFGRCISGEVGTGPTSRTGIKRGAESKTKTGKGYADRFA